MRILLVATITILVWISINAQTDSCRVEYEKYLNRVSENHGLSYSYNEMANFYNHLFDCTIKYELRQKHELYLVDLKTIDSIYCLFKNNNSLGKEVLNKLDSLNLVSEHPYEITKINLKRYIKGTLKSFRQSCDGFPNVTIKKGSQTTTPEVEVEVGGKNSKEVEAKTTDTKDSKIDSTNNDTGKIIVKPNESPEKTIKKISLDIENISISFNDLYLNSPIIYLTGDKKHFLEFCMVNEGSFNLGITSEQYNNSLMEAGDRAFNLNIQDEVTKSNERLSTIKEKFFISKYELSIEQYNLIMKGQSLKNDLPFTSFTVKELNGLLNKLNTLFPNIRFDIPNEIEWEYAAKGPAEKYYMSTNNFFDIEEKVVVNDSTGVKPIIPSDCLPSHINACNMIGNVKEICRSNNEKYTQTFNQFDYVARGGSFLEDRFTARTTSRHLRKNSQSKDIGIRLIIKKK